MVLTRRKSSAATHADVDDAEPPSEAAAAPATDATETFFVAKSLMLRLLGLVYFCAFVGAYLQNGPLLGKKGLSPAAPVFQQHQQAAASRLEGFKAHPAIWWWIPLTDTSMEKVAISGMVLSALVTLGFHSWLVMLALWLLDFSIVTAAEGSSFYQYGWESQLLETGFLAIFLCEGPFPFSTALPFGAHTRAPPSPLILYLLRWLCFRISIGAGLIKMRGGSCWEEKTCLHYHFETQPIPSPLSFFFHFLPKPILSRAVDLDLFVQFYSSWTVLIPGLLAPLRWIRRFGGATQALFMVNIALSGNLGFLNHLTVVPALAALDDSCWPSWLRAAISGRGRRAAPSPRMLPSRFFRLAVELALVVAVSVLSYPVVANLLQLDGRKQVMNSSFGAFRLVNTYGAFGSVGEARYEPVIAITYSEKWWDADVWTEIELPCKPGNTTRRPCFCAPYHYRLDWNIWFIGFKPHVYMLEHREDWLFNLVRQMLQGSKLSHPLLDASSAAKLAAKGRRPRYARVDMYRYQMAAPLWELLAQWWAAPAGTPITWWVRMYEDRLIPPMELGKGAKLVRAKVMGEKEARKFR